MNPPSARRRIAALLLLLPLVLSFVACGGKEKLPASSDPLGDLSAFLDREGFVMNLSEGDVDAMLRGYSVNGKSLDRIAEIGRCEFADGWSYEGYGSGFSFALRKTLSDDVSTSTLYFLARTEVGGFELPCGITMQDSLDAVTEQLGFEKNLRGRFEADGGEGTDMTLLSENGRTLVFRNLLLTDGSLEDADPLRIVFTETKTVTRSDGTKGTLVRTVEFTFRYENGFPLHEVCCSVTET